MTISLKQFKTLAESAEKVQKKDPPAVLVMQRKTIRNLSNGKKVALYYIRSLDKYITIPYDMIHVGKEQDIPFVTEAQEPEQKPEPKKPQTKTPKQVAKALENIAGSDTDGPVKFESGETTKVDSTTAKSILNIMGSVNQTNKSKLEKMINKDRNNFFKVAAFAHGYHSR